jgi:hypothetical protein
VGAVGSSGDSHHIPNRTIVDRDFGLECMFGKLCGCGNTFLVIFGVDNGFSE